MSKKNEFVNHLQDKMTVLGQVTDVASDLQGIYFDRGYDAVGSDPITDADISSTGLTAANVSNVITLLEQLNNFANNAAAAVADYQATINRVRKDIV